MESRGSVIRRAVIVLAIAGAAASGVFAMRLWLAWSDVSRVAFDPDQARDSLASPDNTQLGTPTTFAVIDSDFDGLEPEAGGEVADSADEFATAPVLSRDEALETYLIIGSDERSPEAASKRADVIMLFIRPADGSAPVLVSIPRDLYLPNPCTGGLTRINANLNGCGDLANGAEQVAVAVEDYTGVPVDHFVVFTFDGFRHVVDRVGGVEICPATAVRDLGVDPVALDLPAGCSISDGYQTLAWVRSRKTEGLVAGQWVRLGGGDLVRNQRQQEVVIQALERLSELRDVSQLTALVEELAPEFALDEGLTLGQVVSLVWDLRSLDPAGITRPTIPVADYVDPQGRWVLVPRAVFRDVLLAANPALAPYFDAAA